MLTGLLLALCSVAVADKPNFLILFVDDLGYNEINLEEMSPPSGGYRGYGNRTQTPHLAQFARDGMVFTSWCEYPGLAPPFRPPLLTVPADMDRV
jgi:arylsulfatase A-like enzyme